MTQQLTAIGIFIAVFAIASLRGVHLGVLMFAAACGVGVWLAGMPLGDVVDGFPVSIMVLLVGVTYFFAIAQTNGTIDRVIERAVGRVGDNAAILPLVFFALTAAISAMGSPLAGLVMAPIGMQLAKKYGVDLMLMALAIGTGQSAGGFAPTSLFGIVTYATAHEAGIALNPLTLFAVATVANLGLLMAAFVIFGGRQLIQRRKRSAVFVAGASAGHRDGRALGRNQLVTIVCMSGLGVTVIGVSLAGSSPDIGVLCLAFGAALAFIDPAGGRAAIARIDWSTVLLVGGIITFVGVLQTMGSVDLLGEAATHVGVPVVTALVICAVAALVSAFASTTGILAALVPLAVPLATSGDVAGWALISALAVCSSIVDVCPFSTTGATLVATAPPEERPRMISLLTRWGMSMVVMGPLLLIGILVLPGIRS